MAKEYRIHIRGKQRENIDIDLMTQMVIMLGRQLAEEARTAEAAETRPEAEAPATTGPDREPGAAS